MKIKKMNVNELIPASYNPRKDLRPGDPEYEKIRRSIQNFGYVDPVIWNKRTGVVVGGHQRLKVMKELGYTEIDVSVVDLDEKQEKALNVALNKISGDWNESLLKDLLLDLDEGDFDPTLTGFDEDELEELFDESDLIKERKEVEFTEELLEEHNYIVLYFDNQVDWQTAVEKLGIETKQALDSKEGYERSGVGRVLKGVDVIGRLD